MEVINQLGHLQYWGLSPAINFLEGVKQQNVRVLLTGCSDLRHVLKTLCDVCLAGNFSSVEVYFHETSKELICRALLLLHVLHEQNLNFDERVELFLDLYANALIKEKSAKYLSRVVSDLLNLIHDQPKTVTILRQLVDFKHLKGQERDDLSEIVQSWNITVPFEMEKLRDQRLRYLYKDRYDYRANLIDWDYNMMIQEYAPVVHFYHYREWRQTGLAFENRYSTYVHPNRTLSSYIPGRKKDTKESCMVRGYWGDIVCSPYIAMGIECDYPQAPKLFQKANEKYLGHAVQITQYNLRYFLERLETLGTYNKIFDDYYRSEQRQKDREEQRKKEEEAEKIKSIKEEAEEQEVEQKQRDRRKNKAELPTEASETKDTSEKPKEVQDSSTTSNKAEEVSEQKPPAQEEATPKQPIQQVDIDQPLRFDPKKMTEQEYEAKLKVRRQAKDARQIDYQKVQQPVLEGLKRSGFKLLPMCMNIDNLKKKKYQEFFDVGVVGFSHSAYFEKDLKQLFKSGSVIYAETARFIATHRKEEREGLNAKLESILTANGLVVADRKLKHHLECHKL